MKYLIDVSAEFGKSLKEIAKNQRSIKQDIKKLGESLAENPHQGILIKENTYKIRMAITSKGRGKSGGARVITYVIDEDETVVLIDIYDKSEQENISDSRIQYIIDNL